MRKKWEFISTTFMFHNKSSDAANYFSVAWQFICFQISAAILLKSYLLQDIFCCATSLILSQSTVHVALQPNELRP